jgi:hypothetical protein
LILIQQEMDEIIIAALKVVDNFKTLKNK